MDGGEIGLNPLHCHDPLPEDVCLINDMLMLLTPRQREAVELYSYGATQGEIAMELGVTQQTVWELLKLARERLENL